MVEIIRRYRCETCRREHFAWEEARSCETSHIVDEAVGKVRADIARIFQKVDRKPARLKS